MKLIEIAKQKLTQTEYKKLSLLLKNNISAFNNLPKETRIAYFNFERYMLIKKRQSKSIKQGNFNYMLVRGITGELAKQARQGKPITSATRGLNYWMHGEPEQISITKILNAFDQDLDDNYGSNGGVLISTTITVPAINGYLVFPTNWGMAGDIHKEQPFKRKISIEQAIDGGYYIVSKGPTTQYKIVKDYI